MTLVSAIAARTTRLRLIATINPVLFHPAVAAKIIATIDDVSNGAIWDQCRDRQHARRD